MTRSVAAHENQRRSKARRDLALARHELRGPSEPRTAAAGPTSHAVKTVDPESARAIAAFLARKGALECP